MKGNLAGWMMYLPSGKVEFSDIKAQQLGYDPKDFGHYQSFTSLVHPDDYEPMMDAMRDVLEGRESLYKVSYRIKAADGRYHVFTDQGVIQERDGKNITLFGTTRDDGIAE